jgi:glycosyltransferase involved in cell wall biosynthesis
LAAGLPLVICYTNGAQDLVQEHGVGVVVPPADERALAEALRSLLLHPAERERMRQRARQVAQGLDWSALAQRCVEFYRQLLERGDG